MVIIAMGKYDFDALQSTLTIVILGFLLSFCATV